MRTRILCLAAALTLTLSVRSTLAETGDDSAPAKAHRSPHKMMDGGMGGAAPAAAGTKGKVVETMDSGGYTYVQVDDGTKKIWAAAPKFAVKVGDEVIVPEGQPMPNFHSSTMDRTFDLVYFVGLVTVLGDKGAGANAASPHGAMGAPKPSAPLDLSNIKKADGGFTIAEIFAKKADLTGKEVSVRGKVAKFTAEVMNKNWIHLQDGTGDAGANDLTVTTSATVAVGNTVLVRGKLSTDKDFGYGYKYELLIEDATVTAE